MTIESTGMSGKSGDKNEVTVGRILVVDHDNAVLLMLVQMLKHQGHEVSAHSTTDDAKRFFDENPGWADVVLTDMNMPRENGLSLLRSLWERDNLVVGMVITGNPTMDVVVESMRTGVFDFITKPFKIAALSVALQRGLAHRRVIVENREYQRNMERLVKERTEALETALQQLEASSQFTLEALVSMLEVRERATGEHSKRVAAITVILARALGVEGVELEVIRRGAFLHDIGKVAIPDAILQKPARLDREEWEVMKTHVEAGYFILRNNPDIREMAEIVYSHHEHYDGSGYPRGLKGEAICLGARIFAVADAYDAIRFPRPYSAGRSAEETLAEIVRCRGSQFDPAVVDVLAECQTEIEEAWPTGASQVAGGTLQPVEAQGGNGR